MRGRWTAVARPKEAGKEALVIGAVMLTRGRPRTKPATSNAAPDLTVSSIPMRT